MKITAKDIYDLIKGNEELSDLFISDKKDMKITIDEEDSNEFDENETFEADSDEDEDSYEKEEDEIATEEFCSRKFREIFHKKDKDENEISLIESFIQDQGYTSENGVLKNEFGDYLGKKDLLDFLKYLGK